VVVGASLFPAWTLYVNVNWYCAYIKDRRDEYLAWLLAVRRVGSLALPITLLVICSSLIVYYLARADHARPQVAGQ